MNAPMQSTLQYKSLYMIYVVLMLIYIQDTEAANYYIRTTGNDSKSGTSNANAWKTLNHVNADIFFAGDTIFLQGGNTFAGNIYLAPTVHGTPQNPLVITSYGGGRATIQSGTVFGFYAYNNSGIVLSKLIFKGSGSATNVENGVIFYTDLPGDTSLPSIQLLGVEVYGYLKAGILISSYNKKTGYRDVLIKNCVSHDNGETGLFSYSQDKYGHHAWLIDHCTVYHITGRSDITNTHTGNGILLSGIDSATVQYCEAYNNGQNNAHVGGGPAAIWTYIVDHALIQYCVAHHNHAGKEADGCGFDFDGGTNNSIMQYNYSYSNEGPGYLVAQYVGAPTWNNNIIRYNISQNDSRKNNTGAISIWGGSPLSKCLVHNNTVFVNRKNMIDGSTPACVSLYNTNYTKVEFMNNIFTCVDSCFLVNAWQGAGVDTVFFKNNNYYSYDSVERIRWNDSIYTSVNAWLSANIQQERRANQSVALIADPLLQCAGCGVFVSADSLHLLTAYTLKHGSPDMDRGLAADTNILPFATQDFFGNALPNQLYDLGVNEADNMAPELILWGADTILMEVYDAFVEPGFQAIDQPGGTDLTTLVKVSGLLDTAHVGDYTLIYSVEDAGGNISSQRRVVQVRDTVPPEIFLIGSDTVSVWKDSVYTDRGYIVSDNYTATVTVDTTGNYFDTQMAGMYQIIYQAADSSGNHSRAVKRVILVKEWVSVPDELHMWSIFLYPNPATDQVFAKWTGIHILSIELVDGSGILKGKYKPENGLQQWNWSIDHLPPGVYTFLFTTNDGVAARKWVLR